MTNVRKKVAILAVAVLVLSMLAAISLCPATNAYAEVVSAEDSSVGAAEEATEELVTECEASSVGEQPTRGGYNFEGWFSDSACTQEITDVAEAESSTVYAKWAEKSLAETYNAATSTYEVSTYNQLKDISSLASFNPIYNDTVITANINLRANIPFPSTATWIALAPFYGTFNGNGYKIVNFRMDVSDNGSYGLFKRVEQGAVIQNLTFALPSVTFSASNGSSPCIGLCAGICKGSIINCHADNGTIYAESYLANAGILVGICDGGIIKNCTVGGGMTLDGYGNLGGIAGSAISYATVDSCDNYATILYDYRSESKSAAGIVGRLVGGATVKYCSNFGLVKYNGGWNSNSNIHPYMAQIVGWNVSGQLAYNQYYVECEFPKLYDKQQEWCKKYEVGRVGE